MDNPKGERLGRPRPVSRGVVAPSLVGGKRGSVVS